MHGTIVVEECMVMGLLVGPRHDEVGGHFENELGPGAGCRVPDGGDSFDLRGPKEVGSHACCGRNAASEGKRFGKRNCRVSVEFAMLPSQEVKARAEAWLAAGACRLGNGRKEQ